MQIYKNIPFGIFYWKRLTNLNVLDISFGQWSYFKKENGLPSSPLRIIARSY